MSAQLVLGILLAALWWWSGLCAWLLVVKIYRITPLDRSDWRMLPISIALGPLALGVLALDKKFP